MHAKLSKPITSMVTTDIDRMIRELKAELKRRKSATLPPSDWPNV